MLFFNAATAGVQPFRQIVEWICRLSLRFGVQDRELREQLRPDYRVGCKRVVINGTFYKALQQPNAHVEQTGIDRVIGRGVQTVDGELHELDVLVYEDLVLTHLPRRSPVTRIRNRLKRAPARLPGRSPPLLRKSRPRDGRPARPDLQKLTEFIET